MPVVRHVVREDLAELSTGDQVLVACSGGADSVALAFAMAKEASTMAVSLAAVTIDHGLQPGSDEHAEHVIQWLRGLGYPQTSKIKVEVGNLGGVEAAARNARYEALEAQALRIGATAIYLGHSMDDQAESVLLGLGRGSGPRSIAGMERVSGLYRRPLLGLRRTQLRAACLEVAAPIWDDPHNEDERFTRVGLRKIMPELEAILGGGVVEALARTADLIREDLTALEQLAPPSDGYGDQAEVADLAGLPTALRRRALRAMALVAGVPAGTLSYEHLIRMDALITSWKGQGGVFLPGELTFTRKSGRLSFSSTRKVERGSR